VQQNYSGGNVQYAEAIQKSKRGMKSKTRPMSNKRRKSAAAQQANQSSKRSTSPTTYNELVQQLAM